MSAGKCHLPARHSIPPYKINHINSKNTAREPPNLRAVFFAYKEGLIHIHLHSDKHNQKINPKQGSLNDPF